MYLNHCITPLSYTKKYVRRVCDYYSEKDFEIQKKVQIMYQSSH